MTYSENDTISKRLDFIDWAKAFGIFCVVYAHTPLDERLQNFIYVFHMPLFFFISGYLFSYKRNGTYMPFVKKRALQLMVPYIFINLITYLFWLFVARHVGAEDDSAIAAWLPLAAAAIGNAQDMVHNVPLWFLMCLFLVETLYYPLFKKRTAKCRICLTIAIGIIAATNYLLNPILLPFCLGTVMSGMVFYAAGHEAALKNVHFNSITIALIALVVAMYVSIANGRINMHKNYYGNMALFFAGGFAGTYAVIASSRACAKLTATATLMRRFIGFISDNTLYVCGFHLMCFAFVKGILVYCFHVDLHQFDSTIVNNLLFSIAAMLVCLTAIKILRKWYQCA